MSMSENRGFVLGPEARVCLVRRHDGYAVAVVLHEGPFDHETAERVAASERRHRTQKVTKREAAQLLGISTKGVDYLRSQGVLTSESQDNGRVLIDASSVHAEHERRHGSGE